MLLTSFRVAALKCRQRKKQWLANLQAKVELFSTENDALSQTVTQLREELVTLKSLLLAHKDCPISQEQGINAPQLNMYLGGGAGGHHANPYGMGMQNGLPPGMQMPMPQGQQGQMQRR
jgi:ATF/CREB family transcription factor